MFIKKNGGKERKKTVMFIDYIPAIECKNSDSYGICCKCEECGRRFNEAGEMVDDGGTHIEEDE